MPGNRGELLRLADLLAEVDRLLGRHRVAVHDVQRISRSFHVQPGDGTPRAADREEGPVAPAFEPRHAADLLVGDVDGVVDPAVGGVEQPQAAERQRYRLTQGLALHLDDLQAAAAEVAGKAVGGAEAHHDAVGGQLRLALTGQDLDPGTQRALAAGDEVRAVRSIPAGGRGNGADILDAEDAHDRLEAAQRCQRALRRFPRRDGRSIPPAGRDRTGPSR